MKDKIIQLIRYYQQWNRAFVDIRPLPIFYSQCRFYPSCSEYSIQAIEKYGLLKGILKTGWRILKCNPFIQGGIDHA
ncbi:MAG TPA: membrane protein insertion efficiency factor YidD [Candidatus Paceibacterota bacterium]|nr:membrane protein insertion efficiency factor YidD [Candidatus Paceibacterota bacterium]